MANEGRSVKQKTISQTCELTDGLNCAGNQGPNVQTPGSGLLDRTTLEDEVRPGWGQEEVAS